MGFGDDVFRDILYKLAFRLQGILAVRREAESFADTEDMSVHRHGGLVPDDCTDHVRRLAADTLQRLQVLDIIGHDTVVDFYKPLRHLHQVLCFTARITDGLDVFEHLVARCLSQGLRRRVGGKKRRRHYIDPLVRALRGEHHSYQALERVGKHQLTLCHRHVRFEPSQYVLKPLFGSHGRCDLKIVI